MSISPDLILDYAYLGLDDEDIINIDTSKTLLPKSSDKLLDLLKIIRDPTHIYTTCKLMFNIDLIPIQQVIINQLYGYAFPMLIGSRGLGKTWLLAVYGLYRMLINPGIKIVVVGAAFRQSKHVALYMEKIWYDASVLQSICLPYMDQGLTRGAEKWKFRLGNSECVFLPVGNGETIRGERGNLIFADEFSAHNQEVFEVVIRGFAAVSASPIENVKQRAKLKRLQKIHDMADYKIQKPMRENQTVISGTAFYDFNIFSKYHDRYKMIIESKGDPNKIREVFPEGLPPGLDWEDFCIIRIPYELIDEGFMDEKQIAGAKATVGESKYLMEYGAVFVSDSQGFFKRSLIESCTPQRLISIGMSDVTPFGGTIFGDRSKNYIMGVDPASEVDNLSIVIVELCENYRKVVYCWTTNRQKLRNKITSRVVEDADYYGYCARKIRDLMKMFNIANIAIDTQGGGFALIEALHSKSNMEPGELPIYPVLDGHILSDGKERDEDDLPGLHIIQLCKFASADYVSEINHGLRMDMENKVIFFPRVDSATLVETQLTDPSIYDTLEDCVFEIEELKNELTTIVHTQTGMQMRDRWDTPEVKLAENKKGRMRKDRYSALVMANGAARMVNNAMPAPFYREGISVIKTANPGIKFVGPEWFTSSMNNIVGAAVRRTGV